MLVLRLGEVHENHCERLSTTTDWVPLDDFREDSLDGMELRCCPTCIDTPTGHVSVSELPDAAADEGSTEPHPATRAVRQQ